MAPEARVVAESQKESILHGCGAGVDVRNYDGEQNESWGRLLCVNDGQKEENRLLKMKILVC